MKAAMATTTAISHGLTAGLHGWSDEEGAGLQLGPPAVRLKAFQFWVHSRQFPEAHDRWGRELAQRDGTLW